MTVRPLVLAVLLAVAPARTRAQEIGADLSAPTPTRPESVLETASGLSPPRAASGASRVASPVMAPLFRPGDRATAARPARIEVVADGTLAADLRSVITTDLSYVTEVRLADGAELVLEASGTSTEREARVTFGLRDRAGERGVLQRTYEGPREGVARFLHRSVDDAVETLTGRRSAFESRLVFARRVAAGRKDVYAMDADGSNLERVSSGRGVATLPNLSESGVWYTIVTPTAVFITRSGNEERPVVTGPGVHMGATECDGRLYFSSARDGNTDIYSAALDGSDERRLTNHAAIEVSPTCASDGRLAFVSDRTGSPQIWVMDRDGSGERQLTRLENAAQTPAWCGEHLAFTVVGGGPMRVVVMNLRNGAVRRISPAGRAHKDPAFSPDCRMIAFTSERGVEIATTDGRHVRLVAPGHAETVRWGANLGP